MIANTLTSLAPILTDTFEEISPVITDTLNACMPFVQDFLVGMGDTLKKVMPMVTELAAGILPLWLSSWARSYRLCSTSHSSYSRRSCRSFRLFYRRSPASLPPCSRC